MKKLFLVAVCFAATGVLFGQSVQFGLKGGVNVASLNVEDGVDYDARVGFYAGGLAHIHVTTHFAVQPEIYYSSQGGKSGDVKFQLGYLNIPLLLQYMTGNGFRLQTGPQLGIALSAERKDESEGTEPDVRDNLKDAEFAWTLGASYQFPRCGLGIDARYNFGISNIAAIGPSEIRNRVLALGLFYQFGNNHK